MYEGGISNESLVQMRRLQPLDTQSVYGYITTLAICTYPTDLVSKLAIDIKLPNSLLYNDQQDPLRFNISQQINSAIGIYLGDTVGGSTSSGSGDSGSGSGSSSGGSNNGGGDVFENNSGSSSSSSQKAKTVGIAIGAIAVAGAYGGAMFVIARQYKRKRMARARSSSLSGSNPSMMQAEGSPAMMGGALMSRDFSNYGAMSGGSGSGGGSGGRDSHGSGRSNMNNSGRTAYISAPVAAENSLGWN